MSTDEGQIMFFDTSSGSSIETAGQSQENTAPTIQAIGCLGGPQEGIEGRIKDFEILNHTVNGGSMECPIVVAGSSDGTIRLWALDPTQFARELKSSTGRSQFNESAQGPVPEVPQARQLGRLIGTFETGNRITCLKAFVMSDIIGTEVSTISNGNHENASTGLDEKGSKSHES